MADEEKKEKKAKKAKPAKAGAEEKVGTKSVIQDIMKHSADLGIFDYVRVESESVEGEGDVVLVDTADSERQVIMKAELNEFADDLDGCFGFCNLPTISKLIKLGNYSGKGGKIAIKRKDGTPQFLEFSDGDGNSDKCVLMDEKAVNISLAPMMANLGGKRLVFDDWNVEFAPDISKIEQFVEAAGIYSGIGEDSFFTVKTDGSDLVLAIGSHEHGVHGRRVFATGVEGTLEETPFNVPIFLKILRLGAKRKCTVHFSPNVAKIRFNSGIGTYNYVFPARVDSEGDG